MVLGKECNVIIEWGECVAIAADLEENKDPERNAICDVLDVDALFDYLELARVVFNASKVTQNINSTPIIAKQTCKASIAIAYQIAIQLMMIEERENGSRERCLGRDVRSIAQRIDNNIIRSEEGAMFCIVRCCEFQQVWQTRWKNFREFSKMNGGDLVYSHST